MSDEDWAHGLGDDPVNTNANTEPSSSWPHATQLVAYEPDQSNALTVPVGRPAVPKTISTMLDREDDLILTLKQQGFGDRAVADELRNRGLTDYKDGTISSRYRRLQEAFAKVREARLTGEMDSWSGEQDVILINAYLDVERRIAEQIEALRNKRFDLVALEVNKKLMLPKFFLTGRSCQDRYNALVSYTARPPSHLDDDPEAREVERQEREAEHNEQQRHLQAKKELQSAQAAYERVSMELDQAARAQAKVAKRQALLEQERQNTASRAEIRKQTSLKRQSIIADFLADEAEKRRVKAREHSVLKALRKAVAEKESTKAEEAAQRHAEERKRALQESSGRRLTIFADEPVTAAGSDMVLPSFSSMLIASPFHVPAVDDGTAGLTQGQNDPQGVGRVPVNATAVLEASGARTAGYTPAAMTTLAPAQKRTHSATVEPDLHAPGGESSSSPATKRRTEFPLRLSNEADSDPRTIMSKNELMALVTERGMSKNREKETKDLLASRLRDHDKIVTSGQLNHYLRRRGLKFDGNRADRLWRLIEFDARNSKEWRPKHTALLQRGRDLLRPQFTCNTREEHTRFIAEHLRQREAKRASMDNAPQAIMGATSQVSVGGAPQTPVHQRAATPAPVALSWPDNVLRQRQQGVQPAQRVQSQQRVQPQQQSSRASTPQLQRMIRSSASTPSATVEDGEDDGDIPQMTFKFEPRVPSNEEALFQ